jgi:WD40 repeat protein/DNA-binding SARP family transcriptional activator
MELSLSFLGPFQALWRQSALEFATDSARALLAYLAVEGDRPHPRANLAALLWPDRPQETAYSNLRQTLARVRKALQSVDITPYPLIITLKSVEFRRAAVAIDVVHFEELGTLCRVHEHVALASCPACLAHMSEAVALYRGDFLQDLYMEHSQPFEEWMVLKREQLQRQALDMLHGLTVHAGEVADYPQMAYFANRQLAFEPWREEAHQQLMWALAMNNQRDAALAQYATCCRILVEELDAKPAAETTTLYERIRAGVLIQQSSAQSGDAVVGPEKTAQAAAIPSTPLPVPLSMPTYQILSEAPNVSMLFGRQNELAQLVAWLAYERCQVVAILGMGGVGKSTLAASVVQAVSSHFDLVIWRSLVNAPPLDEMLRALLQILAGHRTIEIPTSLDEQMALLLSFLRQQRCLLVLDNLESVLSEGAATTYRTASSTSSRPSDDGYRHLVQRLAESKHTSCLLLTSRQQPKGLARLEEDRPTARSLRLSGLDNAAGKALLIAQGLRGDDLHAATLVSYYSGNPLALKVVVETVHDLFAGDIGAFLASDIAIFDDIRTMLDQQFALLSPIEQGLLFWLAIEREPVSLHTLRGNLLQGAYPSHALMEGIRALERRSLLEQSVAAHTIVAVGDSGVQFKLQNVVLEYVTERLIEELCGEIEEGRLYRFHTHALLKTRAKEYVRRSQERMILGAITTRLIARLGQERWVTKIKEQVNALRSQGERLPSYAAGNLLNLLLQAGIDVRGFDFSHLSIWQGYLQHSSLHHVDFRGADFKETIFTHLFGNILAFQLQGKGQMVVASSAAGTLRIWRFGDVQASQEYPSVDAHPISALFSADGEMLATVEADHCVRLWEVATGRLLQTFVGHTHFIWAVAFTPDGKYLATAGADRTVHVWDAQNGNLLFTLLGHADAITAVAFSANGRWLASGSVDGRICLWEMGQTVARLQWQAHSDEVHALLFDATSSLLISGSHDSTIGIWQVGFEQALHILRSHIGPVRTLTLSAHDRILASGGGDNFVILWDIHTGQMVHTLGDLEYPTTLLAFSPDGRLFARIGTDPRMTFWDAYTWQHLNSLQIYTNPIYSIAFTPDGTQLLSGSADGTLCLWDASRGEIRKSFHAHEYGVTKVAFSPDGRTFASGSDDCTVCLWDVHSRQARYRWRGHTARIECLRFSPTGDILATGSSDRTLRLWDIGRGQTTHMLSGHQDRVLTCAFHPSGKMLASAGIDRTICLWAVASGQRQATLFGHRNAINGLAFSADGRLLASSSYDCTVRLWDGLSGQSLDTVIELETVVLSLAFDPNEAILALGCVDHSIHLWHLPSARELTRLHGHSGTVEAIAFSPDGQLLASCSVDETIHLWNMSDGSSLQTLHTPGLYAGMMIAGVTSMSEAQKIALKMLGAIDDPV